MTDQRERAINLCQELAIPENEQVLKVIIYALNKWTNPPQESFKCKARSSNMGANDPQECNWPVCGCDPYADKVIEALQESGVLGESTSVFSRPECPFNYCDTKAPHDECKEKCRHAV